MDYYPLQVGAFSRRDFLKCSGLAFISLLLPPVIDFQDLAPEQQGRVLSAKIHIYDQPSYQGKELKVYWKDTVLPISGVTVGDKEPNHNRIWYRIADQGFTHSGNIQPVRTIVNQPNSDIPEGGRLAEITVPFTDAHWGPGKVYQHAYRYYFETTCWVTALVQDAQQNPWYRILDDKWELTLYAPANHIRLVAPEELMPLSPEIPPQGKRIEVRISEQLVVAYEWDRAVFMARTATGAVFSNGSFLTPTGRFITFHKRPSRHMVAGNLAASGYDLPGVPWNTYFTESGVALHGTYWHNDFGRPRSHGCVNLTPQAAKWFFLWSIPVMPSGEQFIYEDYGTQVDVI